MDGRQREIKQVMVVRKDLKMGVGKTAAQTAHASLLSYIDMAKTHPRLVKKWLSEGGTKIVLKTETPEQFSDLKKKLRDDGLPFKVVKDAGQTQVPPGTETAIGIGPFYIEEIDKVTSTLKLL